jgi:hypothetical protein
MEALTNFLINSEDYFNLIEFDQEDKYQNYLEEENFQNIKGKFLFDDTKNIDNSIIEHVEDKNYLIKEQEIKFKIFDDISSVTKNKDNKLELILTIPKSTDIMTINKIKLSKNIKQYVFDIFVSVGNDIVLNRECIYNQKIILSSINVFDKDLLETNKNYIDCTKGPIQIHIILEPNSINEIINNSIYVNYSFVNYKSKVKFFY